MKTILAIAVLLACVTSFAVETAPALCFKKMRQDSLLKDKFSKWDALAACQNAHRENDVALCIKESLQDELIKEKLGKTDILKLCSRSLVEVSNIY